MEFPKEASIRSGFPVSKVTPASTVNARLKLVCKVLDDEFKLETPNFTAVSSLLDHTSKLLTLAAPLDDNGLDYLNSIQQLVSDNIIDNDIPSLKLLIKYCADSDIKPVFISPNPNNEASDLSNNDIKLDDASKESGERVLLYPFVVP